MQLPRSRLFLLAGLVSAYVFFLAWYHCPYAGGSDASGYMNSAKLLLEGRFTTPVRVPSGLPAETLSPWHMFPLGFRLDDARQNLIPTYPVGLPLHFAAVGLFIGLEPAATVVGIASALAFALLLYLTGREFGVRPDWSLAMALLGALSPIVIQYALQAMSDLVAAAWTLAMILFALRSARHAGWAAGAGAAFALAVLVRPTNLLLLLPAALALPLRLRTWIAFGLGGLPGALFLASYNHALYGAFLSSGYGDVSSLFSARHVPITLWHYSLWVPVVATPLVLAGIALPWLKIERQRKFILLVWAASMFLFYAAYEPTQDAWWYLRFVLPALPALAIAAALALQQISLPTWFLASRLLPAGTPPDAIARGRVVSIPLALVLLLGAAGWMVSWDRKLHVADIELEDRTYPQVGRWVNENLPADAVLVVYQVSGAVLYYTDRAFVTPANLTPAEFVPFSAWLERERRQLYAVVYPFDEADTLQRMPGRWEVVTRIRQATVWRRLGPASPVPSNLP